MQCVGLDKLITLKICNRICGVMGRALLGQCFNNFVMPFSANVTEKGSGDGNWHPVNRCRSFIPFM